MDDNINAKSCKRENYILSGATAIKLNKEFIPHLFNTIRLGDFPLYNYWWFSCEAWKQLNLLSANLEGG